MLLSTGNVPEESLYKNKGEKQNPDNYRGITLSSGIGKLFTSVLN